MEIIGRLDQSRCEKSILYGLSVRALCQKKAPASRRFGSRRSPYLADGPASVATEMAAPETAEVADATSFDSDIAVHGVSIHLSADTAADVDSRDGTTRGESGDPRSSRSGDDDRAPEGEGTTAANGGDAADDPFSDPVAASTMANPRRAAATRQGRSRPTRESHRRSRRGAEPRKWIEPRPPPHPRGARREPRTSRPPKAAARSSVRCAGSRARDPRRILPTGTARGRRTTRTTTPARGRARADRTPPTPPRR